MATALLAITALLLPWIAGYLALGIILGPILLRVVDRSYGVQVDYLRDTPVAIVAWIGIAGFIFLRELNHSH